MTIFSTLLIAALFALGGVVALATIWTTLRSALPAIRALRRDLSAELDGHAIHVATLDTRTPCRPARSRRHMQPKPVTHRLHQYPHRVHAA